MTVQIHAVNGGHISQRPPSHKSHTGLEAS